MKPFVDNGQRTEVRNKILLRIKKHFFFFVKKFENILVMKPKKALKLKT